MRLWLSKNSAASLREQLTTQLLFGILSEDLKTGEKLPSVRELARRYSIHSNTVSAAYRDLEARGWVTSRKGSGVYVADLREKAEAKPDLDGTIERFLAEARTGGFSAAQVRERLASHLPATPVCRIVVAEPEPELCEILAAELRGVLKIPLTGMLLTGKPSGPRCFLGAAAVALASRARQLRASLPAGTPRFLLHLRSIPESLQGQRRPGPNSRIAVASASPEILRHMRTLLAAAAVDPAAVEFRDAREDGWREGLHLCEFVIADILTARKLPPASDTRILRVVSNASLEELQRFLRLVTE